MTSPVVRPAVPEDLEAVAKIFEHYVSHTAITFEQIPPAVAEWRHKLDDLTGRGFPFLVAEVSGDVAGYAYVSPWRPKPAYQYTVEDSVYLAPDRTGAGLGSALLGALLTSSERAGLRQMIAVIADVGSDASVALHRRFGFADVGRLAAVGFKHQRWTDTVLMQRTLAADPNLGPLTGSPGGR